MNGPRPNEHTSPHVGLWALLLGVFLLGLLVFFPALSAGYYFDDHVQMAMVRGRWALPRSPFDLYNFVDNSQLTHLINEGALPWWSSAQLRLRFLRPLASLLLAVDYSLFPKAPWPSHLHSFAWWFASAFAAHGLFQRVLSRRAAGMATILFAFAPSHVVPIAWAANREALISLFFGILSLSATLDWLHLGKPRHAFAAAGAYVLSLSGGEYALSLLGYSLMLGIARQDAPKSRRLVAVLATALPAVGYLVLRGLLGCGAKGAGFYLDPVAMPWAFLEQAPRRYFLNFLDVWCGLGGRALLGTTTTARIGLGLVVGTSLAPALVHTFRRLPPDARPNVRGLLGGSLLSIVPMLAVAPAPRLLGLTMVGVASTVALVLESAWWPTSVEPRRGLSEWTALMATVLGFAHFLHAPLTAYLDGSQFRESTRYFERAVTRTLEQLSEHPPSTIVVLRGLGTTYYLPYALQEEYGLHARWSVLAQGPHVLLLRTDAQSLELVAPPDGTLVPLGQDQLFRGKDDPFRVQDTLDVQGMQVTVLETNAAGPRRIRFRFHHPLDDGTITWLTETVDGLKPVTLPEVGFGLPIPKTSDP